MSEAVSIRQERIKISTYPLGPDSLYPTFEGLNRHGLYPYSMKRDFSTAAAPHEYQAVILENRYVRAVILPELGGRVYSLYDKTAREETFLVTPSIKYQAVAVRGAWIAGGIEFNFGHHGHTVATVSPVAWATRPDPDGGGSVWVGSVVRPTGSRWAVRIGLKGDRAALDLEIHTMGPIVLPGMTYWWTNAAVEVTDLSRFFYFGRYADSLHATHSWPIVNGKDYRWCRNRTVSSDMFLMEPGRDYMGFYDYSRHHGVAQTADRRRAPGQKYFTWGADQRGRYWDLVFSDSEQTYCEIQRGHHPTQHMADPIAPFTHECWRETWTPLAKTEGFSATENDLVLSVAGEEEGWASVRLTASAPREKLRLEAASGDEPLGRWEIDRVEPGKMFIQHVELAAGANCDRVKVFSSGGETLLDWEEYVFDEGDWYQSTKHGFDEATATAEELFLEAQRTRFAQLPKANRHSAELLGKVLARDAGHSGARGALAELALYEGRNDEAVEHLREVLKQNQHDCSLRTLLGWALVRTGKEEAAAEFSQAAGNESDQVSALIGLAGVHIRTGRLDQADEAVERILAQRPADRWGRLLKVMVLRKSGSGPAAAEVLRQLLGEDPLWPALHAEALLLEVPVDLGDPQRKVADDAVTAAEFYLELGQWDDAQAVLRREEFDEPFSPAVRLALLAYCQHCAGEETAARQTLQQVRSAPDVYAHPSSATSLNAIADLARHYGDEPMLQLMLGNVLASRGRLNEAGDAWDRASRLGLASAVLYRNLAILAAHNQDKEAALAHYRTAWELSGGEINLFVEFDRFLASCDRQAERGAAYEQLSPKLHARPLATTRRLLQYLDTARYDDALDILTTHGFARMEGDRSLRTNYLEAVIGKAVGLMDGGKPGQARRVLLTGLEYPRNIHIGRSSKYPEEAPIHFMLGLAAELAGDAEAARHHWSDAADEPQSRGYPCQAYQMLSLLALGERDATEKLLTLFEQLGRGEEKPSHWYLLSQGENMVRFMHSMAHLARGRIDQARSMWEDVLTDAPDIRWVRLHLNFPRSLLQRMCRQVTGPAE